MSIVAYTGLPGSGKSYGVVEHVIVPALVEGRAVYTNIPLNELEIFKYLQTKGMNRINIHPFSIDDAKEQDGYMANIPGGAVIVIDEIWRLWPSGMKANGAKDEHKSFLAEHRHRVGADGRSQEIVLVTQDLAQIAAFARQLVEETFRATKLTAIGQTKKYRIDIFPFAATGQKPSGQATREIFGIYKPEVFRFYKSHTMSETGAAGQEKKIDTRGNALKSALIKYGLPGAVFAISLGAYGAYSALNGMFGSAEKETQSAPVQKPREVAAMVPDQPVQTVVQNQQPKNQETGKPYSKKWRLAGFIESEEGERAFAWLAGRSRYRQVPAVNCRQIEGTFEHHCEVDGEIVTPWSGEDMNNSLGIAPVEKRTT